MFFDNFSLFAAESCLYHIGKLSHGSISLGQQIAYWWCIHRQLSSKKVLNHPTLLMKEELILDSFFDYAVTDNYRQEFDLVYYKKFDEFPSELMELYSRYQHGLLLYHSLSYRRKNRTTSYRVFIEIKKPDGEILDGLGEILFFFYVNNRPFYLFKQFFKSKNRFSSLAEIEARMSQVGHILIDIILLFVTQSPLLLSIHVRLLYRSVLSFNMIITIHFVRCA